MQTCQNVVISKKLINDLSFSLTSSKDFALVMSYLTNQKASKIDFASESIESRNMISYINYQLKDDTKKLSYVSTDINDNHIFSFEKYTIVMNYPNDEITVSEDNITLKLFKLRGHKNIFMIVNEVVVFEITKNTITEKISWKVYNHDYEDTFHMCLNLLK